MFFSQTASRDDEYSQSDSAERAPDSGNSSFFRRPRTAREESDYGGRPRRPAAGATHGLADLKNEQSTAARPSIGRRALRTVVRFSFVLLIGVSATLAWQSYNEQAKELVRHWVPALAWLLPASPVAAENLPKLGQELKPIAIDLALVRRSVEQLASDQRQLALKQDNIAQDIAALQAVERDLRQNISSVPPPAAVPLPRHKPAQPPAQSPVVQ
jgi:hypothetical protein